MLDLYEKLKKSLETVEVKYQELQKELSSDTIGNDIERMTRLQRASSSIEAPYNLYMLLKKDLDNFNQAKEMFEMKDPEFMNDAKMEMDSLIRTIDEKSAKLQVLLLPKDQRDDKNIIVEIRGAAGGDEANIFAGDLYKMYTKYFEIKKGYKLELLSAQPTQTGGFSYISFSVKGHGAYSLLKWESGSHRVQRVPATESKGRVHTSTATVLVMPEADEIDFTIKQSDLRIDTFRSSGAGGQHVNTTDSAIRITHLPTGAVSQSQDGRSQHKNKEIAMTMLKAIIFDKITRDEQEARGDEARAKIGTGDRSEKIRTYNYPQNRVTDHRIGLTINKLDRIVEGEIQPIIDGLLSEEQRQKIESSQLK